MRSLRVHGDYWFALAEAPLAPATIGSLAQLLGHKGKPWLADIRRRYAGQAADVAFAAFRNDQPISHLWIGADSACPRLGVLGHVYTRPEHRGQGLAKALVEIALDHVDAQGTRVLVLGVDSPIATALYERAGFRTLHGPDATGHRVMIRGAGADELLARRWLVPGGAWCRVPFTAAHYAAGILLLNTFPGARKLWSLAIDDGHDAELRLLEGMERHGIDGEALEALVDEATGCLLGLEHVTRAGRCRYMARGVPSI